MDATPRLADTAIMETPEQKIEGLLTRARDITHRTLGKLPAVVLAEVFRQLCMEAECEPPLPVDESMSRQLH